MRQVRGQVPGRLGQRRVRRPGPGVEVCPPGTANQQALDQSLQDPLFRALKPPLLIHLSTVVVLREVFKSALCGSAAATSARRW